MNFVRDIVCENGMIRKKNFIEQSPSKGAGHVLFKALKKHSEKVLQIDGVSGEEDTYKSVLQRSIKIALQLKKLGVARKDIVAICTPNHLNTCVPFLASLFIGAILTNLDHRIPIDEGTYLMEQIEPKVIFVGLESVDFIETVLKATGKSALLIVFGQLDSHLNFFDLLDEEGPECDFEPVELDETENGLIYFSSGSTGLPKGVYLSHRAYLGHLYTFMVERNYYDRIFESSSSYWAPTSLVLGITVLSGHCRIIAPMFDPHLSWTIIDTYKPMYLITTPFTLNQLWSTRSFKIDVTSVRKVSIVGGLVPDHQLITYQELFPSAQIVPFYGMTETGPLFDVPSNISFDQDFLKTHSCCLGTILGGVSYKVVDPTSEEVLGPYQVGELRIKSKNQFSGYHNLESVEAFDADGWTKTGDLLYYDKDFFFYYVDRLKTLIKYQTSIVAPIIIEKLLMTLDYVRKVCVIGVPDEIDGEHPMAVVQLRDDCSSLNVAEEISQLVEEKLGGKYILRGGVKIVKCIPSTITGKTDIRKLKSLIFN